MINSDKKPLVTVLSVVRNLIDEERKDFFIQNLESVKNQDYPAIEHLVVDGASCDGTCELLKTYADKKWIRYVSEPDNGIYDAMNKGHKLALGEYIIILNSDDYYASNDVISQMVCRILTENADYVYGNQQFIFRHNGAHAGFWQANMALFWCHMPFNHPAMLIKKKAVEELGYYSQDFTTVADYKFIIDLILNDYKGAYLDKTIINFRTGGISGDAANFAEWYVWSHVRLVKMFAWFYSKFDDRISEEFILENFDPFEKQKFDKKFIIRLSRFMLEQNLKNFDYESFLNALEPYFKKNYRLKKIIKKKLSAFPWLNNEIRKIYYNINKALGYKL